MKKKSKGLLGTVIALAAIVLGIVSLCMLFAPCVGVKDTETTYTGAQLMFGYTKKLDVLGSTVETELFKFSANFVTFVLLIVGIVLAVLALLGKLGKIAPLVSAACFIVAGVFWFLIISFCSPAVSDALGSDVQAEAIKKAKETLELGAGAIVGGILSILAGFGSASLLFIKK